MSSPENALVIPEEVIISKIYLIRELKVMIDSDLAELYGVETKVLKQQVKRNIERFPDDFMFELTNEEFANLRSQIVTSSWGGRQRTCRKSQHLSVAIQYRSLDRENWGG